MIRVVDTEHHCSREAEAGGDRVRKRIAGR
jgi:hypothetical protein